MMTGIVGPSKVLGVFWRIHYPREEVNNLRWSCWERTPDTPK
jgi:hypothetical protein